MRLHWCLFAVLRRIAENELAPERCGDCHPTRMRNVGPDSGELLDRVLVWGGLACLAAITLADRGATRMYASPWSLAWRGAVAAPLVLLAWRTLWPGRTFHTPTRGWLALAGLGFASVLLSALFSPYRAPSILQAATLLAGVASFLLVHDWLKRDLAGSRRPRVRGADGSEPAADGSDCDAKSAASSTAQTRLPSPALRTLEDILAIAAGAVALASLGLWLLDVARLDREDLYSPALFAMRNPHPLGHSNYTAGLALLGLPWLFLQAFRRGESKPARRILGWVGMVMTLAVLFTSGSRGGLIGLAALGVAGLAAANLDRRRFALLGIVAVIGAALLAVANPRIRAMLGPPEPKAEPNASTVQRKAMLQAGWQMGLDRPLFGWGPGTTPLAYPRYRASLDGGAENVLQLHSTPVEAWATLGAAGIAAMAGFAWMVWRGRKRSPAAAAALAGYGVFALTDYQLDVPVFTAAVAVLAAMLVVPAPVESANAGASPAGKSRVRFAVGIAAAGAVAIIAAFGRPDPTPRMNVDALEAASHAAGSTRATDLLRQSLALNPDQEIAHFNLGWLLLADNPSDAETHFLAAARLVPDKGGVYFGLGLARLNQGKADAAAAAFALECLDDPSFIASPWWTMPALAEMRDRTAVRLAHDASEIAAELPSGTWAAEQAKRIESIAANVGRISPTSDKQYRRERTGYPVLMRNLDIPPPTDLYDVRENPDFAAALPFPLPPKGWLPSPLLLKRLEETGD